MIKVICQRCDKIVWRKRIGKQLSHCTYCYDYINQTEEQKERSRKSRKEWYQRNREYSKEQARERYHTQIKIKKHNIKICATCGVQFIATHGHIKYCCVACKNKHAKKYYYCYKPRIRTMAEKERARIRKQRPDVREKAREYDRKRNAIVKAAIELGLIDLKEITR